MTIAELHAGPLTTEEIETVVTASRRLDGRFTYLDVEDPDLDRIAQTAIATDPAFARIKDEAKDLGYVTCGMIAQTLNRIVRQHHANQYAASAATFARKLAEQRRAAGFCIRCGRRLTDERSIAAGIGPECAAKLAA